MPSLYKIHEDGTKEFKEAGARVEAVAWNEDRTFKERIKTNKPIVGCSFLIGSVTSRSYSDSDYWLTTVVTEILNEDCDEDDDVIAVRFKTENSEYLLRY